MIAVVLLLMIWTGLSQLWAQEKPTFTNTPCIASGETVYQPGVGGVKPPQPKANKKDKSAPDVRGPFSLEVLVNSDGHVCDTRVLRARDKLSAERAATYILGNWTFKPATKQGKPVAVRFTMNFRPQ